MNGVTLDGPAYPDGAANGSIAEQPNGHYARLERARLAWQGGARGLDRPLDKAFVITERFERGKWRHADDDLGLSMLWQVSTSGRHQAQWEIPLNAHLGRYRFVVQAKRYRLESQPFEVGRSRALRAVAVPAPAGKLAVTLTYPEARRDVDLTSRPQAAAGGAVRFRVGGKAVRIAQRKSHVFSVPAPGGTRVTIEAGQARDGFGNVIGEATTLR